MAFDYPSNFSNGTIVDGIGNLIKYGNYVSSGFLAYGFLVVIFALSFTIGVGFGSRKAILSSSFITFVFSIYFMRIEAVSMVVPFLLVLIMIGGALGSKEENTTNM